MVNVPESIAPTQGLQPNSGERHTLAGRIVDARGQALVGHLVRLSEPPGAGATPGATRVPLEATTDADGRFTLADVRRGGKLLELFGPGKGDIAVLERDQSGPAGIGVGFRADEGKIYLAVPPDGLAGIDLVGPSHACFWVRGELEREDSDEEPQRNFLDRRHIQLCAAAPEWNAAVDPEDAWWHSRAQTDRDPTRVELQLPEYQRTLDRSFLVGAVLCSDTLLSVFVPGYATQARKVKGEQLVEQAGAFTLERVAGLVVVALDAATAEGLDEGTIELRETGGGLPDRVSQHEVQNFPWHDKPVGRTIWSERRSGRYELRINVPGYAEWTGAGDLILAEPDAEPPRVTAELHPAP
jgi:hypothetical protein